VAIAVVRAVAEAARRADYEKAIFNIAQNTLCVALAVFAFQVAGGEPFLGLKSHSAIEVTRRNGLPAFAAVIVFFAANSLLVSSVIARANGSKVFSVWKANNRATVGIDII